MNLRHQTKRIFSAALVVWMSGIVLFLCCDVSRTSAANSEIESCPLAKKANCTKTSESDSHRSFETQKPALECCNFPALVFDKIRKLEKAPQSLIVTKVAAISAPKYFLSNNVSATTKVYQSFVLNRESTYLRNRVFRI